MLLGTFVSTRLVTIMEVLAPRILGSEMKIGPGTEHDLPDVATWRR